MKRYISINRVARVQRQSEVCRKHGRPASIAGKNAPAYFIDERGDHLELANHVATVALRRETWEMLKNAADEFLQLRCYVHTTSGILQTIIATKEFDELAQSIISQIREIRQDQLTQQPAGNADNRKRRYIRRADGDNETT